MWKTQYFPHLAVWRQNLFRSSKQCFWQELPCNYFVSVSFFRRQLWVGLCFLALHKYLMNFIVQRPSPQLTWGLTWSEPPWAACRLPQKWPLWLSRPLVCPWLQHAGQLWHSEWRWLLALELRVWLPAPRSAALMTRSWPQEPGVAMWGQPTNTTQCWLTRMQLFRNNRQFRLNRRFTWCCAAELDDNRKTKQEVSPHCQCEKAMVSGTCLWTCPRVGVLALCCGDGLRCWQIKVDGALLEIQEEGVQPLLSFLTTRRSLLTRCVDHDIKPAAHAWGYDLVCWGGDAGCVNHHTLARVLRLAQVTTIKLHYSCQRFDLKQHHMHESFAFLQCFEVNQNPQAIATLPFLSTNKTAWSKIEAGLQISVRRSLYFYPQCPQNISRKFGWTEICRIVKQGEKYKQCHSYSCSSHQPMSFNLTTSALISLIVPKIQKTKKQGTAKHKTNTHLHKHPGTISPLLVWSLRNPPRVLQTKLHRHPTVLDTQVVVTYVNLTLTGQL